MTAPSSTPILIRTGQLHPAAIAVMHWICGIPKEMLEAATVHPSDRNWLHFPWFPERRGGGAFVLGQRIYFTRNYFRPSTRENSAASDGSRQATLRWCLLLAHEVGHLPQARAHGSHLIGKCAYVLNFARHYAWAAMLRRWPLVAHVRLEIEADRGRKVMRELLGTSPEQHPLLIALHQRDESGVLRWMDEHANEIAKARVRNGLPATGVVQ